MPPTTLGPAKLAVGFAVPYDDRILLRQDVDKLALIAEDGNVIL